ncbi:MAG TPA: hypothetical protein VJQ82_12205 [Terriglobales bacterium]|nr:hypothetical protein [Terriglobales bacterium]
MRYWRGSIALSPIRDYPLLRQVLRSTFITHGQLYEFMRLEYCATSRNAFNNRVLRLVRHDYLVRDEVPFRTEGYVYSISARGAAELAGSGEYYTGLTRRPVNGQLPKAVYHAIDLNKIHLALKRSEQLVRWTPDTEIRSRNEFTESGYKKDYDAVVTVRSDGSERTFALEYERTAKARKQYVQIRNDIEAETAVPSFLYLVPNYDLLSYIASFFATSRKAVYFGLLPDFLKHVLEMPLRRARPGPLSTLRDALSASQSDIGEGHHCCRIAGL